MRVAPQAKEPSKRGGLLRRLARDKSGNTLAIVGAALVPLTGIIGSGVDMSRAYMAKSRLQSACDAAALAGRRVMMNDQMSQSVTDEAVRFFNFNFQQNLYQTTSFTPTVSRSGPGTVRVSAATTIPTSIMRLFGYTSLPLNVTCDASLNYVNTDVMLVLDVTGSMGETLDGTRKINALRDAVMALYDALAPVQAQLESAGMRLRYGVVPYSSTVNVGALLNVDHIATSAEYQTRVPIFEQSRTVQTYTNVSSTTCNGYRTNLPVTNVSFPAAARTVSYSSGNRRCTVTQTVYDRTATANFGFWYHEQAMVDTSRFRTFANNIPLPTSATSPRAPANRWNGCIEERETVDTITTASGFNIPSGATDLDINLIPSSNATRWKPQWDEVVYFRGDASNNTTTAPSRNGAAYRTVAGQPACPAEARRLQTWSRRTDMLTYVNGLQPVGSTYHDVGMIWGARMISNAGVFADSPDTFNNMPVARHIIFMTDGQLAPSNATYSAYGIEFMDQRITGSSSASGQYDRHLQRFRMVCNAAKGMNASVWVIAFGTSLSADMANCASNANQASTSGNRDSLIQRFTEIGQNIGALRLTQ